MHRHLLRQLRRLGIDPEAPPRPEDWRSFLEGVSRTYDQADRDRYMLERSITLSSREMLELNERLAWERDQFAQMFRSAPAGIIRIELDGTISDLNPAFEGIAGWARARLIGRRIWELGHTEDRESTRDRFEALSAGVHQDPIQIRFLRESGDTVFTNMGLALVRDGGDQPRFAIALVEDLTERIRLEMRLRLGQKLESVGRLAAGIAHEINTPIQFVSDHTSYLASAFPELLAVCDEYRQMCERGRAGLPSEAWERVRSMNAVLARIQANVPQAVEATLEGVERVAHIVQSIKTFAHPARGQREKADLNAALRSTLAVAANELKNVAAVQTELGSLPLVPCFIGDLNQVFLNLLVNAAHAIADKVGSSTARGLVTVRSCRVGDEAVVSVSDTGVGIPPEIGGRIFDPFFTTKDVGRGTGQGLALARTVVVDQHGGSLSFESAVGQGTTFFVRLPLLVETPTSSVFTDSSSALIALDRLPRD
jgi:PAS domain S-box-containing protein